MRASVYSGQIEEEAKSSGSKYGIFDDPKESGLCGNAGNARSLTTGCGCAALIEAVRALGPI